MILILIFLFGTYPQEGDADDTENNPSNMQEENMAGYVLKVPAIETRKVPITHVLSMDEPLNIPAIETRKTTINNMQEEDMAGYGLKAPAIETRKMPITGGGNPPLPNLRYLCIWGYFFGGRQPCRIM